MDGLTYDNPFIKQTIKNNMKSYKISLYHEVISFRKSEPTIFFHDFQLF